MSLIAEFQLESPLLYSASTAVPEIEMYGDDIVLRDGRPHKFVFAAQGGSFDALERALGSDPTVATYAALARFEESARYRVTYDKSRDIPAAYENAVEQDIVSLDIRLQNGTYGIRALVPDRESLAAHREYCTNAGLGFELQSVYQQTGTGLGAYGLTESQQEALLLAYERGYFESPRQTTLEEMATELDISRQALADRLHRGQNRLLAAILG